MLHRPAVHFHRLSLPSKDDGGVRPGGQCENRSSPWKPLREVQRISTSNEAPPERSELRQQQQTDQKRHIFGFPSYVGRALKKSSERGSDGDPGHHSSLSRSRSSAVNTSSQYSSSYFLLLASFPQLQQLLLQLYIIPPSSSATKSQSSGPTPLR